MRYYKRRGPDYRYCTRKNALGHGKDSKGRIKSILMEEIYEEYDIYLEDQNKEPLNYPSNLLSV